MVYFSICSCCLQFLSSMSYSFPSTSLLPLWLDLFLCIYSFDAIVNGIVFLISLFDSSLLVYRNTTDFCILILYPATLLNLFISSDFFWWHLYDLLYIVLCHLRTVIVLLLFFQFGFLLFLFLV